MEANSIINIRVFRVNPSELFNAWTDPALLAQWWGPKGFTNTFQEFDLRPGGYWRFVMHGPDGSDYPNESRFVEITAPKRLVFDHISGHHFRLEATFEPEGNHTKLTFKQTFVSKDEYEKLKSFLVAANEENLDKLQALLQF